MLAEDPGEIATHVHRALVVSLGVLLPPEAPGALDAYQMLMEVEIARSQREALARAQTGIEEHGEEREVPPLWRCRLEETLALLPCHRPDALHWLGLDQLVRWLAMRSSWRAGLTGMIPSSTASESSAESGGLHQSHAILRVALAALFGQEGLDVGAVEYAQFEMAERGQHMSLEALGVAPVGVACPIHGGDREPALGVVTKRDFAILDGREGLADTAEELGRKLVRGLLRREEGSAAHTIDVPEVNLPDAAVFAEPDRELRSRHSVLGSDHRRPARPPGRPGETG